MVEILIERRHLTEKWSNQSIEVLWYSMGFSGKEFVPPHWGCKFFFLIDFPGFPINFTMTLWNFQKCYTFINALEIHGFLSILPSISIYFTLLAWNFHWSFISSTSILEKPNLISAPNNHYLWSNIQVLHIQFCLLFLYRHFFYFYF